MTPAEQANLLRALATQARTEPGTWYPWPWPVLHPDRIRYRVRCGTTALGKHFQVEIRDGHPWVAYDPEGLLRVAWTETRTHTSILRCPGIDPADHEALNEFLDSLDTPGELVAPRTIHDAQPL